MSTSKTKSKTAARKATERFASKNRRTRRRPGLEIGDRVRIVDISPDLKNPNYDSNVVPAPRDLRTGELFRFCLGREFTVRGFGRYSTVELEAGANKEVRKKFGKWHTIWMEPEFLKIVRKKRETTRGERLAVARMK